MLSDLFVPPPTIVPSEYLPETEARKIAGVRMMSPPSAWSDEITQNLLRDHPYIPADRVVVNFKKKDDGQGYAFGYVGIAGAPRISIPLIINNRELQPLDVMILRKQSDPGDASQNQGTGDMADDQVMPLTESNLAQGLDVGEPGTLIHESKLRGAGWTEDGSALRLPYRGRTVLASVMGITAEQREAYGKILGQNKHALAGFMLNGTDDVAEQWLNAPAPGRTVQAKLASAAIDRAIASVPVAVPLEADTKDFLAARVWMDDATSKIAVSFDALDLFNPTVGEQRFMAFEDGTYGPAPTKVACDELNEGETEATLTSQVMAKLATGSLTRGTSVSLMAGEAFTAPAVLTKLATHEGNGSIHLELSNGLQQVNVVLARGVKTASRISDGSWMLPLDTQVLTLRHQADVPPMALDKVASFLDKRLPDSLILTNGQWTLNVRGENFGFNQADEKTACATLNHWFENGSEMAEMVKQAALSNDGKGWLRFDSDLPAKAEKIAAAVKTLEDYPKVASAKIASIAMPLDKAVKLAASIGDPQSADAVLGAGFLTPDNLAEFVTLHETFGQSVQKLARLLLAIRMGFPGDSSATAVAMKSLQRVSEDLESAIQEV
ncbi:MAG: hypothetical protein WC869_00460 [Phycisphaerae bacterium]|jgi:hypothetical protein